LLFRLIFAITGYIAMEEKEKDIQFKEAFKTYNHADIAFIKSLLEGHDIVYYVNNENVNFVGNLTFAEPMRVMVEARHYETAKEILAEFEGNFTKFSNLDGSSDAKTKQD